jgi:cyclopropane fatty-acyl-phospholipid synthase-like methyltransferase
VLVADIRQPPPEAAGPFDLITLHNNVYYFEPEERPELFRRLRSLLSPDGALALTTMMRGSTPASLDLDLGLRSTIGCTPLPALPDVVQQLNAGGFTRVRHEKLMPLEPLYGIVARP